MNRDTHYQATQRGVLTVRYRQFGLRLAFLPCGQFGFLLGEISLFPQLEQCQAKIGRTESEYRPTSSS
jgi:hypothetical protein